MDNKIPKIIHYVWVGGNEKTELLLKCIESWKNFCPDYKIIEWNENNFDIEGTYITNEAYKQKNYALIADYIRIHVLYKYGGIYLDTDVSILKPIDELLEYDFFIGYESKYWFNSAVIGSIEGHPILGIDLECLDAIKKINFSTNPKTVHAFTCIIKNLYKVKNNGKTRIVDNVLLLSQEYFYPQNYITYKVNITDKSLMIHYYAGSWHSKPQKRGARFAYYSRKILGKHIYAIFEKLVGYGFYLSLKKLVKKIIRRYDFG